MDLPLALERLRQSGRLLASDDWGPCAQTGTDYATFASHWRGQSDVPTEAELAAAWAQVVAARRRPRTLASIAQDIAGLSAADRNRLVAAVCAAYLQDHPGFARALSLAIDGDEPEG